MNVVAWQDPDIDELGCFGQQGLRCSSKQTTDTDQGFVSRTIGSSAHRNPGAGHRLRNNAGFPCIGFHSAGHQIHCLKVNSRFFTPQKSATN